MPVFDHDKGEMFSKYDFDSMTDADLRKLLVETPEGMEVELLLQGLGLEAALEEKVRKVVAQGLRAGALLLKGSLGA
jgi:hypothetical protein